MHFSLCLTVLSALVLPVTNAQTLGPVTGQLGNASVVTNNPPGVVYTATLPAKPFFNPNNPLGNIKGGITAKSNPDGIGVVFQVSFSNLPKTGGPFSYHIHVTPVPDSGNCTQTLDHLDPFIRGVKPPCDSSLPQTCQVGDLSGKFGVITSDPFSASYLDEFATTMPGLGSFFGNRSMVIHLANSTRVTCANFVQSGTKSGSGGGSSSTNSPTTSPNATGTGLPPASASTNSGTRIGGSLVVVAGAMGLSVLF